MNLETKREKLMEKWNNSKAISINQQRKMKRARQHWRGRHRLQMQQEELELRVLMDKDRVMREYMQQQDTSSET